MGRVRPLGLLLAGLDQFTILISARQVTAGTSPREWGMFPFTSSATTPLDPKNDSTVARTSLFARAPTRGDRDELFESLHRPKVAVP